MSEAPENDLSDLGKPPPRGSGLANLLGDDDELEDVQPRIPHETAARTDEKRRDRVVKPPAAEPKGGEAPKVRAARTPRKPGTGTKTIYTSESVKKRLTDYRFKTRQKVLPIILAAIEDAGDSEKLADGDVSQLQKALKEAEIKTGFTGGFFEEDPKAVKYAGGGGVASQFRPTPAQDAQLEQLTELLGFQERSTWIAPLLDRYLPRVRGSNRSS